MPSDALEITATFSLSPSVSIVDKAVDISQAESLRCRVVVPLLEAGKAECLHPDTLVPIKQSGLTFGLIVSPPHTLAKPEILTTS